MDLISEKSSHDFLKTKAAQLLLSVSLFSFLFTSYHASSSWRAIFLASPLIQLLTHTMSKSFVFLICNGILVFVAKTSGSLRSRSAFDLNDHKYIKSIHDGLQTASMMTQELIITAVANDASENINGERDEDIVDVHEKEVAYVDELPAITSEEIRESYEGTEAQSVINMFDVEEEEDEMEVLSNEELNKKFDEFIRKMNEEIRVDAQKQLVMVQ